MNEDTQDFNKLKIEIQKNYELKRVENFLRGEVEVLIQQNKDLMESTEFIIGKKIKNNFLFRILQNIKKNFNKLGLKKLPVDKAVQPFLLDKESKVQAVSDGKIREVGSQNNKNFMTKQSKKDMLDYLFVQLSNNSEIGGIYQLNSVFEEMKRKNFKVASTYINKDYTFTHVGFNQNLDLKNVKLKKIIFSGIESYKFIKKIENFQNTKIINFLQGPDYLFPGSEVDLEVFIDSIRSANGVITQSPYLDELAQYLGAARREQITLGPKRSIFFDRGVAKEKKLLISTRKEPDKGLRFVLPIFPELKKQGWEIVGFGDLAEPELAIHFDKHEGRLTRHELAELFQSASLLLDASIYEGLGLTSLEAGLCGVRSMVTRKGGTDSLVEFKNELIIIEDPLNLKGMTKQILNFDLIKNESKRQQLTEKANFFSWEKNIDNFVQSLESF